MSETVQNGATALVSPEIHAAVERAMSDVQTFIDSDEAREKMVWMLAMQVNENASLQKCTPKSFELAIYQMFKLNLDPRNKNEAWLIPRKENGVWKANFQAGYVGARKLALNDPRVDDIFAEIVYENDTYDTDPHTRAPIHRYNHFGIRGPVIGYYGAIRYTSGMWHTEEMSVADMRAWRDHYSAAKDQAVWKEDRGTDGLKRCPFDAMALKTMITAMCSTRHANLSPEARAAVRTDAELYIGERDVTPASTYVPTDTEHQENLVDVWSDSPSRAVPDMTHTRTSQEATDAAVGQTKADVKTKTPTPRTPRADIATAANNIVARAAGSCEVGVGIFRRQMKQYGIGLETAKTLGIDAFHAEVLDFAKGWMELPYIRILQRVNELAAENVITVNTLMARGEVEKPGHWAGAEAVTVEGLDEYLSLYERCALPPQDTQKATEPEPPPEEGRAVEASPEADTSWMPEAELLAWIDAEAKERGVEPKVLKSILTEYSKGWEGTLAGKSALEICPWKVWAKGLFDKDADREKEESKQLEEELTVDATVATV